MSLFVVVTRNKRDGKEYLLSDAPEGYVELSRAREDRDRHQQLDGEMWDVFIGKVVPLEEEA